MIGCLMLLFVLSNGAHAQQQPPQDNPYSDTDISVACPDNGKLFARIITCLEDKIFKGTKYFVDNLYPKYEQGVYVCMSLAVVILGMMLATGGVQSPPKDTFTLLLKMVAVIFFMDNAMFIMSEFLSILASMIDEVASAGQDFFGGTLKCPATSFTSEGGEGLVTTPVWERVDCIIDSVLGLSADAVTQGATTGGADGAKPDMSRGMMAFFYHNLKSGALGLLIGLAGLYIAFNLMLSLFKAAYTYLIAVAILSLMFIIGIFMIPGILFPGTYPIFEKWYKVILGVILQPIILFAYLNVMMIAFDLMLFSGENSIQKLVCASGGGNAGGGGGGAGEKSINKCAQDNGYYIDTSVSFAKKFDPTNVPVALSNADLGTLGNIQISNDNLDFAKPTDVPIDLHYTVVDYKKIDPAELAAATLLAALCSYILLMFMEQLPAMATELAGGAKNNPNIIAGKGSDIQTPFSQQLDGLANGKAVGDASKQVGGSISGFLTGKR